MTSRRDVDLQQPVCTGRRACWKKCWLGPPWADSVGTPSREKTFQEKRFEGSKLALTAQPSVLKRVKNPSGVKVAICSHPAQPLGCRCLSVSWGEERKHQCLFKNDHSVCKFLTQKVTRHPAQHPSHSC